MRRASPFVVAFVGAILAGCGESARERLERTTLADAAPSVEAFAADLDGGRVDAALARTTKAFRSAATAPAVQAVLGEMRKVVGASKGRTPRGAESLASEGTPPVVHGAVIVVDASFERGTATIRARVHRDAARGAWSIDGYEVRSDLFTWTLRK